MKRSTIPIILTLTLSTLSTYATAQPAPAEVLKDLQLHKKIINTHEHLQDEGQLPDLFQVMGEAGLAKVILVGSSKFTLTMNESFGFTEYDKNNEELIRLAQMYPDKLEAWPTINPLDPQKYEKFIKYHQQGATGIKLYSGHGYQRRDNGTYMFHPIAMDDPSMFPLYKYLEDNYIPLCFHVNPFKRGFAQEFLEVLTNFPDMKVIAPHYILSSIKSTRMREFLDTFPNLYSDISYGHDDFIKAGIGRISKDPEKFRRFFIDYPDRFFFGSDLVLTELDKKGLDWQMKRYNTYYDMLTKETYTTPVMPDQTLNGLKLRTDLLEGILYKNFQKFTAAKPQGTKITRTIQWRNMGVEKTNRYPGQAFPPVPKKK